MNSSDTAFARRLIAHLEERGVPDDVALQLASARRLAVSRRRVSRRAWRIAGKMFALPERRVWLQAAMALLVVTASIGLTTSESARPGAASNAAIDAAILSDVLPPSAYTDEGFAQFLKNAELLAEDD